MYQEDDRTVDDSPLYWLAVLERAKHTGDFEGAILARDELERLGVKLQRPKSRRKDGNG